nr:tyrosine-type recombinase/integrase [Hoyosella altamirensis]
MSELLQRVQWWQQGVIDDEGHPRSTPRMGPGVQAPDLLDVLDLCLATGARTSEVFALQWQDIREEEGRMLCSLNGTLVYARGAGLHRQGYTKTGAAGARSVWLPMWAQATVERMSKDRGCRTELLFPSGTGGYRYPNNVRRQWRVARHAAGAPYDEDGVGRFDWVEFRTLRRTVATLIKNHGSLEDAAVQLVTRRRR